MLTQQFEIENHRRENKNRAAGMIVSIIIHSLILLSLFFCFLNPPNPPYEDNAGGMTVNYGTSAVGTGDQQQYTAVPVTVKEVAPSTATTQPATSSSQEDLETQNTEDAPVVEKKTEVKKPKEKPNPDAMFKPTAKAANPTPQPPKPTVNSNALFSAGALGKPNKSKGDGEGGGQGDQGDPSGDPNSRNYHGGGTGNGIGPGGDGLGNGNVRLKGRRIMNRPPKPVNTCQTSPGNKTVFIEIKVDKQGKVVDTKFMLQGSTEEDDCLVSLASRYARQYRFDQNNTAEDIQTGQIRVDFTVH